MMASEVIKSSIKFERTRYILKWILLSSVVGIVGASIILIFELGLFFLEKWVSSLIIGIIFCLPIVGLLLSGVITGFIAPEARGHGTDAIIYAYHHNWGIVRPRVIGGKLSSSLITIGFGGSAGPEGPAVQIGGGISSLIAQRLNLSLKERRMLMLCGISACFGSIFMAPLSGALFACEVVYRDDFESIGIPVSVISSFVGFLTYRSILQAVGFSPLIEFPSVIYTGFDWSHLLIFLILGLICGLAGLLYIKFFYFVEERVKSWAKPEWFKTLCGGIVVTLLVLLFSIFAMNLSGDINNSTYILGIGRNLLYNMLTNPALFSLIFLILLLLFKVFTTTATVGSGGSGGLVFPSIVVGGLLGGVIALLFAPILKISLQNYWEVIIIVSSITFFASVAHVPLTGMFLAGEMFGYMFLVPTLLASLIGSWVNSGDSIYRSSLVSRSKTLKIHKRYKIIE